PYAGVIGDTASVGPEWKLYYASGRAPENYDPGTTNIVVHLAAAKQTIDLGPAVVLNFGPDRDPATLPNNNTAQASAAPASAGSWPSAGSEAKFAEALKELRAKLPVAGRLLNDPSIESFGPYGPGQHSRIVPDKDVPGGEALRMTVDT